MSEIVGDGEPRAIEPHAGIALSVDSYFDSENRSHSLGIAINQDTSCRLGGKAKSQPIGGNHRIGQYLLVRSKSQEFVPAATGLSKQNLPSGSILSSCAGPWLRSENA